MRGGSQVKTLLLVATVALAGCGVWRDAPTTEPPPTPEPERKPVVATKPEPPKPEPDGAVHCVTSPWSEFTPWGQWVPVPDFKSWEMRVRFRSRSQVTPAANGGKPCGQLMDAETEFRLVGGK